VIFLSSLHGRRLSLRMLFFWWCHEGKEGSNNNGHGDENFWEEQTERGKESSDPARERWEKTDGDNIIMCTVGKKERLEKWRNLRAFRSLSREAQAPLLWFLLPLLAGLARRHRHLFPSGNHEWVCGSDRNREKGGEISIIFLRIWSWCQLVHGRRNSQQ